MRIDAHHHVWDLRTRPQPWTAAFPPIARSFSLEDLEPSLEACDIDATVVVQTVTVAEETPELLALAHKNPMVAGVVGWVDLAAPDVSNRLTELATGDGWRYLVGIRHQVQEEAGTEWFSRREVLRGLQEVAKHELAYDLIVRNDQLAAARMLARKLPDLRFVLNHGGNPDIEAGAQDSWRHDISALAALPNVVVKLSGLVTRASPLWSVEDLQPYSEHLLSSFGPARVLFGSDWPVCLLRAGYEQVVGAAELLAAGLSADERTAVFGGNAKTWYRLATNA